MSVTSEPCYGCLREPAEVAAGKGSLMTGLVAVSKSPVLLNCTAAALPNAMVTWLKFAFCLRILQRIEQDRPAEAFPSALQVTQWPHWGFCFPSAIIDQGRLFGSPSCSLCAVGLMGSSRNGWEDLQSCFGSHPIHSCLNSIGSIAADGIYCLWHCRKNS